MAKTDLPEALRQEYDSIMAEEVDPADDAALFAINERVDRLEEALYEVGFVWTPGWGDDHDGEPCRLAEARFGWAWLDSGRSLAERVETTWRANFGSPRLPVPTGTRITSDSEGRYLIETTP